MKIKRLSVLLIVVFILGVLPAQAQDSATIPAASCTAPGDLTVRVWDENWANTVQTIVDKWVADYCPGANVTVNQVPWGQYWDLLRTDAASGDLPDVFNIIQAYGQDYINNDALLNLQPYLDTAEIDPSLWGAGSVDPYRSAETQDVYATPLEWVTVAIYYNKDLFDAAGLEYPTADWTWDDFADYAAQLTDPDNGVFGAAVYAQYQGGYGDWIASTGTPPVVTADHTTCTLQEPGSIEALTFLKGLLDEGYMPSVSQLGGTSADDEYNLFKSGKVAMYLNGAWKLPDTIRDVTFNWDIVPLPHNPTSGLSRPVLHASAWAASASSANPDLAANLVQFLVSDEGQRIFAEAGGVAPSNPNPELQQTWIDSFGDTDVNIQAFVDASKDTQSATNFNGDAFNQATADLVVNIFDLGMSVEEATAQACATMQPDLVTAS
jgi:multiple sugar transport system substrate-binding protein